ncbi:MAG: polysaccharide deacetylase family protein [Polyangiaceae bacterium]|nr:polysaccharide deacetylase family protein [Polyangiaceae bacterium]
MPPIRGKKALLATTLGRLGALDAAFRLRRLSGAQSLTVLTYHSVGTVRPDYPFDPEVVDATAESFDAQLRILRKHCSVVRIDDVLSALGGGRLPPNAVLITFDDGYKSCHKVAFPLLQRHGLPATFFIATDYVEERRLFWWDIIHYVFKSTTEAAIELSYPNPLRLDLSDRTASIALLLRLAKETYGIDVRTFVTHLAERAKVPLDRERERILADELIMTWDEIRELSSAGMDVEGHTRSHRVLQTLTPTELSEELLGCRMKLESELGKPVRTLAYPVGFVIDERPDLCQAVANAGYGAGFSNDTGINRRLQRGQRFGIQRLAMDKSEPLALFQARLTLPNMG